MSMLQEEKEALPLILAVDSFASTVCCLVSGSNCQQGSHHECQCERQGRRKWTRKWKCKWKWKRKRTQKCKRECEWERVWTGGPEGESAQCRHPEACSVYGTYWWCPGFRDVVFLEARSTLGRRCTNQPAPDWRRSICTWPHCARVRPCALLLFISTINTHLSSSPFPPPPQRLLRTTTHRIASHCIPSHRAIALLCSASQHRLANSRVFSSPSVKSLNSYTSSPKCAIAPLSFIAASHRIASHHREQSRLPINHHIRPLITPSINESRITHRYRVTPSSTKSPLSQSP